jgi:hypothetical protein
MLKLNPSPTFKTTVEIHVPGQEPEKVGFVFKHMRMSELEKFQKRLRDGKDKVTDLMLEVVEGWEGVDVAYSPEALKGLSDAYPGFPMSVLSWYINELTKARLGN